MYYVYHNGCILSSPYRALKFKRSDESGYVRKDFNSNERVYEYVVGPDVMWSQIPDAEVVGEDSLVDIDDSITLYDRHTVNGLTFTITDKPNCGRLWSCFIDFKESQLKYEETELGGWVVIPSVTVNEIFEGEEEQVDIKIREFTTILCNKINSESELFYVTGEKFVISNIVAVDLLEKRVKTEWDDLKPFNNFEELYLVEADIIAAFIRECKKQFPEIDFFPQSSERQNLGRETIYYRSALSQNRSPKFSSNLIEREWDGRYFQTTIPIELYYQTADIKQYIHRRDTYLICRFLMDVHHFTVTKTRGWKDRLGNDTEEFNYSTFWERDFVQNDLVKADANDGSGRDTFTLTMQCDLIGFVIEKSEFVIPIQEVITNIYYSGIQSYTKITR